MQKYLKAAIAFAASSMLIISSSLPDNGMVTFVDNSTQSAYVQSMESFEQSDLIDDSFYDLGNKMDDIVAPVVKLNLEVTTPLTTSVVSSATGFSVAYDKEEDKSYVITNDHFCDTIEDTPFGGRFFYEKHNTIMSMRTKYDDGNLIVLDSDPSLDLCLMLADGFIKPVEIASAKYKVRQMDKVSTVGGPAGVFPIMLETRISNLFHRDFLPPEMRHGNPLLMLSIQVFGGQSGSPVYNERGEVIGVIFINLSNDDGPIYGGIAIPLGDLRGFLDANGMKY
jgi:S1-C subfamily serine protease